MLANRIFEEPEVYKLDVPYANIVTKETNVYIIRDQGEILIVDMGAPTDQAEAVFLKALEELDIPIDAPRYFFTHLHFDHSGLADKLLSSGAEVFIGEHELRSGEPNFHKRMSDFVKGRFQEEGMTLHQAEEKGAMIEVATPLDFDKLNIVSVAEGDVINIGRFPFVVQNLFGHTRGMVGLYQPDSGLCFSGDQLLFCITPACGLFLDGVDSIETYNMSMFNLMQLPITHLLHSHGEIRADFKERAAAILKSRNKRMKKAVDFIAENPGLNGIDVVRNMGWRIPFASIDECEQRQQWLIYTQGIAILDHLVRVDAIERVREPALSGIAPMSNTYKLKNDFIVEFEGF